MKVKKLKNLKNLAKFIASIPKKHFDMHSWGYTKKMMEGESDKVCLENSTKCGTACCLAGWQVVRKGYCINDYSHAETKGGKDLGYVPDVAAKQLGLDSNEKRKLFIPGNWPKDEGGFFLFPFTPKGAAKRILHLIEKGE